ncbi:unnamed protein product [Leptosia nina]|uniref:Uncharacterized protein n=1 Tax=Leptosia nina TaxID=320188 RepID=A0AAV1K5U6_9NEOP
MSTLSDRYLDPHQDYVGDERPGQVESDHSEEDKQIGEGREGRDRDEREVDERCRSEEREAAKQRIHVGVAGAEALGEGGAQRHPASPGQHTDQPELVGHAAYNLITSL